MASRSPYPAITVVYVDLKQHLSLIRISFLRKKKKKGISIRTRKKKKENGDQRTDWKAKKKSWKLFFCQSFHPWLIPSFFPAYRRRAPASDFASSFPWSIKYLVERALFFFSLPDTQFKNSFRWASYMMRDFCHRASQRIYIIDILLFRPSSSVFVCCLFTISALLYFHPYTLWVKFRALVWKN